MICSKNCQKNLIHTNFPNMITMSLFYYCENVYPYKYMDDWEKFSEISLPEKEGCHLNMEDITDTDYANAKRVCINF